MDILRPRGQLVLVWHVVGEIASCLVLVIRHVERPATVLTDLPTVAIEVGQWAVHVEQQDGSILATIFCAHWFTAER